MDCIVWNIEAGIITPETELPPVPKIGPDTCVVITGRGPIWQYGKAFHAVHGLATVVAVYDPRLGKGVVVASHCEAIQEGHLVQIPETIAAEVSSELARVMEERTMRISSNP